MAHIPMTPKDGTGASPIPEHEELSHVGACPYRTSMSTAKPPYLSSNLTTYMTYNVVDILKAEAGI